MNYRIAEVMAGEDLGDAGTKVIPIRLQDPISRIVVRFRPVGGSIVAAAHPVDAITRLELVDGSDVLFALKGHTLHALNVIEAPKPDITHLDYRVGGTPLIDVNIDFGRWLYDPELAFDPTRFKNPQLKLSWDEDVWDDGCDSHEFSILAHVFDEKVISPAGFLMTKEIKSYVPVANSYEYTDMPLDFPLRKLILQGRKYGYPPRSLIGAIKLSEDNDKRIPIDDDVYNMEGILRLFGGECEDWLIGTGPAAGSWTGYVTPSYMISLAAIGLDEVQEYAAPNLGGGRVLITPETASKNLQALVRGVFPHGCFCLPFGLQADMADWYDVTKIGSLRLRLKGGTDAAATDMVHIATQQLRRY